MLPGTRAVAAAQVAGARVAGYAVVVHGIHDGRGRRAFHCRRAQAGEMVRRKLCRIMTNGAGEPADVLGVLTGVIIVVLRCPRGMTGRALGIYIDGSREPDWRRLSAVTTHVRAGCGSGVERGSAGFRIIHRADDHIGDVVAMQGRAGPRALVAGRANDVRAEGRMRGMPARYVRERRAGGRDVVACAAACRTEGPRVARGAGRPGEGDAGQVRAVAGCVRTGCRSVRPGIGPVVQLDIGIPVELMDLCLIFHVTALARRVRAASEVIGPVAFLANDIVGEGRGLVIKDHPSWRRVVKARAVMAEVTRRRRASTVVGRAVAGLAH